MSGGAPDAPRYTGVRTFASLPQATAPDGLSAAVLGVPFDTATSYRAGARFGPEAIRSASALLRTHDMALGVDALGGAADCGDVVITPGNAARTMEQIAAGLEPFAAAGVTTMTLGGDHSISLGELRAHAAAHGAPLALVLLDAHADVWDAYYGEKIFHGTPFRRAVEEGLLAPERSLMAGMRGPLYDPADLEAARDLGFEVLIGDDLRALDPTAYAARVLARVGDSPAFLSFDVDVVDPAFAPGTGTPEVGGLTSVEALGFLRALAGMRFVGFDVVEVSPPYDGPGQVTALLAANVAYTMLGLAARAR
ncbi:MAG: agmatinase [Thermoleophilaceae bacterium]